MFREIQKLARSFEATTWAIEDQNGKILTGKTKIAECWETYCQELYCNPLEKLSEVSMPDEKETDALQDEIRRAIEKLKNNKAPGANYTYND